MVHGEVRLTTPLPLVMTTIPVSLLVEESCAVLLRGCTHGAVELACPRSVSRMEMLTRREQEGLRQDKVLRHDLPRGLSANLSPALRRTSLITHGGFPSVNRRVEPACRANRTEAYWTKRDGGKRLPTTARSKVGYTRAAQMTLLLRPCEI
ncbi:unnamed protein product [Lota lota]